MQPPGNGLERYQRPLRHRPNAFAGPKEKTKKSGPTDVSPEIYRLSE